MAILYTVESYSTFKGIIVDDLKKDEVFISLIDLFFKKDKIPTRDEKIIVPKKLHKYIDVRRIGMVRHPILSEGSFLIKDTKIIMSDADLMQGKIIYTKYRDLKVLKGIAEYIVRPKENLDYVLIHMLNGSIIELLDEQGNSKEVKYKNLHEQ